MDRNEIKNLILAVTLTAIMCVTVIAAGVAMSVKEGKPAPQVSSRLQDTPSAALNTLQNEEPKKIGEPTPSSASQGPYDSGLIPNDFAAEEDRYWMSSLERDMLRDWYFDTKVKTASGISYLTPVHHVALSDIAFPAALLSFPWSPSIDFSSVIEKYSFYNADGGSISVAFAAPDQTRVPTNDIQLNAPSCAPDTSPDVAAATALLLEQYGITAPSGDPCALVKKYAMPNVQPAWWKQEGEAVESSVALYVLDYTSAVTTLDGRGPMMRVMYHPAVILSSKITSLEEAKQRMKNWQYRLIETNILGADEASLARLKATVDQIHQTLAQSTVDEGCGYDFCF